MSKIGRIVLDYEKGTIEIWRETGNVNKYIWSYFRDCTLTGLVYGHWITQNFTNDFDETVKVIFTKGVI